jgi:hypothetical protein
MTYRPPRRAEGPIPPAPWSACGGPKGASGAICGQCAADHSRRSTTKGKNARRSSREECGIARWPRIGADDKILGNAKLLVLSVLVLVGAAYVYYWYSPAPRLRPLSATVRQAALSMGGRERNLSHLRSSQLAATGCSCNRPSWVGHGWGADAGMYRL